MVDLLSALNTGHEGGCGTVHANSAADVPARLEALGAVAGMSRAALHSQLASALDLGIHLRRGADGLRRVEEIVLLEAGADGLVRTVDALTVVDATLRPGRGAQALHRLLGARGAPAADLAACGLIEAPRTHQPQFPRP